MTPWGGVPPLESQRRLVCCSPKFLARVNLAFLRAATRSPIGALRRDIREAIDACSQLIDWTRAESVGGRDPDTRRADCDSAVWKLSDVKLLFRVGGKRYRLVIDNPRQFGGVYVVSRGPVCELDAP